MTRKRTDLAADTYAFLGCDFEEKTDAGRTAWLMTVNATNIELSDFRSRYEGKAQDITIDGRAAIMNEPESSFKDTCFLAMESPVGVLDLQLTMNAARATGEPCDRIQEIATTLQSELPNQ